MLNTRQNDNSFETLQKYIFGDNILNQHKKVKVSVGDLYGYVFGNKAEIKPITYMASKKIKKPSDKNKKPISPEEIQHRKEKENLSRINLFKESLGTQVISNPHFRKMLREVKAELLEASLYGNTSDLFTSELAPEYVFPTDNEIEKKFAALNSTYHFFDINDNDYHQAINQFVIVFKECKLMADYVEKNNDADNSVAAMHAYQILVLFGTLNPFAQMEQYLMQHHGYDNPNPIHDALVTELPKNIDSRIHDLAGWRVLICQYGLKAVQYFQNAAAIEGQLQGKAPKNLKEASNVASKLTYSQHDTYPALAELCMQHNISEATYNKCLEINTKRKTRDNLPGIQFDINGADVSPSCSGYYFAKLINDPRDFLLGHITNCCQSIGGHSEACVIDGITRENNGFYVLLKNKNKISHGNYRLDDGSINYDEVSIVGQGYAWMSRWNNLTFDSWENLRTEGAGISECLLLRLPDDLTSLSESMKIKTRYHWMRGILILYNNKLFYINLPQEQMTEIPMTSQYSHPLLSLIGTLKQNESELADHKVLDLINAALGDNQDDSIAVSMLTKFAETVTTDKDLEIMRVTIGRGGKTPGAFKVVNALTRPEIMAEGKEYRDSREQNLIYINKKEQEKIVASLMEAAQNHYPDKWFQLLKSFINTDNIHSNKKAKMISTIFLDEKYKELSLYILSEYKKNNTALSSSLLFGFSFALDSDICGYNCLINEELFSYLNERYLKIFIACISKFNPNLSRMLMELDNFGLLNTINCKAVLAAAENAEKIATLLMKLHDSLISINQQDNAKAFFEKNDTLQPAEAARKLLGYLKGETVDFGNNDIEALSRLPSTVSDLVVALIRKGYPMPKQIQEVYCDTSETSCNSAEIMVRYAY